MALPNVTQTGLQSLMDDPYRKAVESSLYDPAAADIERSFGTAKQASNELDFSRGMGYSSQRGYNDALLEGEKATSLAKARAASVLGGGAEARANLGASQGVFSATSDVALRQAQLAQQASQYTQRLHQEQSAQNIGLLASGAGGLAKLLFTPQYSGGPGGLTSTTPFGQGVDWLKNQGNSWFPSGPGPGAGPGSEAGGFAEALSGGYQPDLMAPGTAALQESLSNILTTNPGLLEELLGAGSTLELF